MSLLALHPAISENLLLLALCVAFAGVAVTYNIWQNSVRISRLPPGPPGNRLAVGPRAWLQYDEWAKKYGPVYSFRNGSAIVVVLATYEAAVDIMQKHGNDLADRPPSIAAGKLLSGDMRTLLVGSGERLRRLRRALHSQLQPSIAKQYAGLQTMHAKNYVRDILNSPEHFLEHGRTYAASVIMNLTYGKTSRTKYSDPVIRELNRNLLRLSHALGLGSYLVDTFPFLRFIPLGGVAELKQFHKEELSLFKAQVELAKERVSRSEANASFATYLLEHQKEYGLSDDELAYLAGSMFGAGSDTTAAGLGFVIMAAAVHPDEWAKVQAQIDEVVGRQRLPSFEDQSALTRVTAFVHEAHRWRTITPGAFAHRATKDIFWRDYVIPEGAIVIGNHWSVMHDPAVFPDPYTFKPDRWINREGNIRDDLKHFDFGYGRRVCVGQYVAERSLFINTALVAWSFNIHQDPEKPIDTFGFTDGSIVHPSPFAVRFEARGGKDRVLEALDAEMD
ncbi:cytochrome P450 [Panus rudis PR-1116 ss-1]|nr:cytochrome P450 [Panus rudis PR-1116 ss-1]